MGSALPWRSSHIRGCWIGLGGGFAMNLKHPAWGGLRGYVHGDPQYAASGPDPVLLFRPARFGIRIGKIESFG